jgi:hypothetical protein
MGREKCQSHLVRVGTITKCNKITHTLKGLVKNLPTVNTGEIFVQLLELKDLKWRYCEADFENRNFKTIDIETNQWYPLFTGNDSYFL